MDVSVCRIATTHTGSLPRSSAIALRKNPESLRTAVEEIVRQQAAIGLDIINDGEAGRSSYVTYLTDRISGLTGERLPRPRRRGYEIFADFAAKRWGDPDVADSFKFPSCDGPIEYSGLVAVDADIKNLQTAAADFPDKELFMTSASPGVIEMFMANRFYRTREEYIFALADAMKIEYDEVSKGGITLQIDCPDLTIPWAHEPVMSIKEFRAKASLNVEALNFATRDIPADAMRMHVCWGNYEGPHHTDIPLAEIIDIILAARPAVVVLEGANPRHGHEWEIFEDVTLPDGKKIIPGVIDTTTNYIEHPRLVAQRLMNFASMVGKEALVAGTDCGFGTFAHLPVIDQEIAWAKLAALVEGARLASSQLW